MTALKSLLETQNDMPMTGEQTSTLHALLSLEKQRRPVDALAKHIKYETVTPMFLPEPDMPSVLRVLYERLVWAQCERRMTRALALWIGLTAEDHHSRAVLWAYATKRWCDDHPDHVATLEEWNATVIANGLPSTATYAEVWQLQRRRDAPNGNALDMPQNWL